MAEAGVSEACERNKDFILEVLKEAFSRCATVLEIGSGTGQHAAHFARNMPELRWQPSDKAEYLNGLNKRLSAAAPDNVEVALELDVRMDPWPVGVFDGIFSANSLHFMSWDCVVKLFRGVGRVMSDHGALCIYGPFCYSGEFTSESNAQFDEYLRQTDPDRGIRNFEAVNKLAEAEGLVLISDVSMPANNRTLVWRR